MSERDARVYIAKQVHSPQLYDARLKPYLSHADSMVRAVASWLYYPEYVKPYDAKKELTNIAKGTA